MRNIGGWKIATVRGVDIRLHISLIFILAYVMLVAGARFPMVVRDTGLTDAGIVGGPLLWGTIFAIALLVSIVLHELGHVFTAQSMGVKVRSITLMMLGGVSEMEQIPDKRFQEFKVALVGPLVSFAIAAILYGVEKSVSEPNLILFSYWLGRVNLVLGIFNLLPAFPMDGGRVLRSLLAAGKGNLRATQIAVEIGKVFAWTFGILGLFTFNILLMLIALFLYIAASSELVLVMAKNVLKGLTVRDVAREIDPIPEASSVEEATERMMRAKTLALPVRTESGHASVITIQSIRRIPRNRRPKISVSEVMEKAPKELHWGDPIDSVLMELNASGALPVVHNAEVVGLVLSSDISEVLQLKALEGEAQEAKQAA